LATVGTVRSLLFDVTTHDPITLVAAPVVLIVIAVIACALPARRATNVEPMITLRSE